MRYGADRAGDGRIHRRTEAGGPNGRRQVPQADGANRGKKRCARYRALSGGFTDQGVAGPNSFTFSGRIGGRALRPGRYRLLAKTGTSSNCRFAIAG